MPRPSMPILAAFAAALVAAACQSTSTGQLASQKAVQSGEALHMACQGAPLHERPDGFARVIGQVPFGAAAKVVAVDGQYVPTGQTEPVPAWAMVEQGGGRGWVSSRCLVPAALLDSQRDANAAKAANEHLAAVSGKAGGRGFGEDEAGDTIVGSRGAAGAARARGSANFAAVDQAVAAQGTPGSTRAAFRREGGLGEFRAP